MKPQILNSEVCTHTKFQFSKKFQKSEKHIRIGCTPHVLGIVRVSFPSWNQDPGMKVIQRTQEILRWEDYQRYSAIGAR